MAEFPFSKIRSLILIVTLAILCGGIGYRLGEGNLKFPGSTVKSAEIINTKTPSTAGIDFSMFWDVWDRIHHYWIDAPSIDNQKLVWGAISGMVNALDDPYTTFFTPKENQDFKEDLGGAFEGIGAQLGLEDNKIIIIAPLKGSPAEAAGIKTGDWIMKVNSEDTLNWSVSQAVTKIRGPKGSKVTLTILHKGGEKPAEIAITRNTITVPSVDAWIKTPAEIKEISGLPNHSTAGRKIAYIHLSQFGDRLEEDWSKAVTDIVNTRKNSDIAGLVFDVRNNPGGYLDGSVYIGSEFIKSGTIVSQKNSDGSIQHHDANGNGRLYDIPMVVLINKGSASAAEIVSGALKDYHRATIVGETSYGKGSVQTPQDLAGGSSIHITTGKWLTPKGESINKKGITPDTEIKLSDSATASEDAQLEKAIEILEK